MSLTLIDAPKACASVGPYSQCVRAGNSYYLCGQVPFHPVTGEVVGTTMKEQAEQTLANLEGCSGCRGAQYFRYREDNRLCDEPGRLRCLQCRLRRVHGQPPPGARPGRGQQYRPRLPPRDGRRVLQRLMNIVRTGERPRPDTVKTPWFFNPTSRGDPSCILSQTKDTAEILFFSSQISRVGR